MNMESPADSPHEKPLFLKISESVYVKTTLIIALTITSYINILILKPDNFNAIFNRNFLPKHVGINLCSARQMCVA